MGPFECVRKVEETTEKTLGPGQACWESNNKKGGDHIWKVFERPWRKMEKRPGLYLQEVDIEQEKLLGMVSIDKWISLVYSQGPTFSKSPVFCLPPN